MKFYARQKRTPTVIIVSLIDIFAILLIFVIVTTTFRREQPQVEIKLPESTTAEAGENKAEPAMLRISKGAKIFVDETPVAIDELRGVIERLQRDRPDRSLAMSADTDAPFGIIIRVLDVLREAGVKDIPALTERKGS